jgi:hypothetical protein
MGKAQQKTEVKELTVDEKGQNGSGDTVNHVHWQPGYAKQFPWVGAACLLGVVCTAIGCALVLYFSNNRSCARWPSMVAPNVAVSVLNAIGNICLLTAMSRGIPVAWWIKAMEGATVSQLHNSWSYSVTTLPIFRNLFRLDVIGLAVLVAKISVVDSILYQRATSTYVGQDSPRTVPMQGVAATAFPSTGYVVAEGFAAQTTCECFMIGDEYTSVVNTWQTSNGFFQGYNRYFQECDGVCYAYIDAIGFEIDCTEDRNVRDIAVAPIEAFNAAGGRGNTTAWSNIPIFNTSFAVDFANGAQNQTVINLDLQYFQSKDPFNPSGGTCQGTVTTVQCKLRPALVRYPLMITNFTNPHVTNGVSLGSLATETPGGHDVMISNQNTQPYSYNLKQAEGFDVLSYLYPDETGKLNGITYLGGLANALHIALTSTATISYQGGEAWSLSQTGVLAQTMMYGPPNMGSCDCSFRDDSLSTIVASINQLAFLTATGLIDQESVPFPTTAGSNSTANFLVPQPKTYQVTNTSQALTIQGVASNTTTNFRSMDGTMQVSDVTFFQTHFLFVGLGVGMTMLCVITTASLFWRYGTLGRDVSLGPIEVAGAFGAPILSTMPANSPRPDAPSTAAPSPTIPRTSQEKRASRPAPISVQPTSQPNPPSPAIHSPVSFSNMDDLLAKVGHRSVLYGMVDVEHHDDGGSSSAVPQSPGLAPSSPGGPNSTSTKRRSQIMTFGDAGNERVRPATTKRRSQIVSVASAVSEK